MGWKVKLSGGMAKLICGREFGYISAQIQDSIELTTDIKFAKEYTDFVELGSLKTWLNLTCPDIEVTFIPKLSIVRASK